MNSSAPPQDVLQSDILSNDDIRRCIHVLRAVENDRSHLTRLTQDQRRELLTLAGLVAKPERHDLIKMAKAFRRAEREAEKRHDREMVEQAGLRVQRRAAVYTPLWLEPPEGPTSAQAEAHVEPQATADVGSKSPLGRRPELRRPLNRYVCKQAFATVHRYYDSLCETCGDGDGDYNYAKRGQTADLSGRYALVTGARVKIGIQASLKLLRAGAHVIVTTRFPVDAAARYAGEKDFAGFGGRLQIHGIDLRHAPSVELFARFLNDRLPASITS